MKKYLVSKAILNENGKLDKWETDRVCSSYTDAENRARELSGGFEVDVEPSTELPRAYFGQKGKDEWSARIIIK